VRVITDEALHHQFQGASGLLQCMGIVGVETITAMIPELTRRRALSVMSAGPWPSCEHQGRLRRGCGHQVPHMTFLALSLQP
jgi:hypothetical protein